MQLNHGLVGLRKENRKSVGSGGCKALCSSFPGKARTSDSIQGINPSPHHTVMIFLRNNEDLNVKSKTLKLFEGNIGRYLKNRNHKWENWHIFTAFKLKKNFWKYRKRGIQRYTTDQTTGATLGTRRCVQTLHAPRTHQGNRVPIPLLTTV